MSNIIDNRIVELLFDNSDFEKNVKTSMNSLDNLNKSIDTASSAKGLSGLADSVKNVSLDGIAGAVENISGKFSALGIIAKTVLEDITHEALQYGERIAKAFTIEPVIQGYGEYELKMNTIQTIMAGTGESLETVNGYLDDLNTYADRTIYSFSDMTQNISKFTNAGVKLKDAVGAIQGISNEAALAGANAAQASHAMYNFGQAMSSGYVKLIDWKSIENATMDTKEFKEELIKTGVELGTLTKVGDKYVTTTTDMKGKVSEAFGAIDKFRDSLSHQWLTTEVLTTTLNKYADETTDIGKRAFDAAKNIKTFSQLINTLKESIGSGWAHSFEIIIGDFEKAKTLWKSVFMSLNEDIEAATELRNTLLTEWSEGGGRIALIDALSDAWNKLKQIIEPVKKALNEVFPPLTAQRLIDFSNGLKEIVSKFTVTDEITNKLYRTFKGLFSILDLGKQAFSAIGKVIGKVFSNVDFLEITAQIGDFFTKLNESAKSADFFNKILGGIYDAISRVIKAIANLGSSIKEHLGGGFVETIIEGLSNGFSGLGDIIDKVKEKIVNGFSKIGDSINNSKLFTFLEALLNFAKSVGKGVIDALSYVFESLGGGIKSLLDNIKIGDLNTLSTLLNEGLLVGIVAKLSGVMDVFKDTGKSFGGVGKSIKGLIGSFANIGANIGSGFAQISNVFKSLSGYLEGLQKKVKSETILKIAEAVAVLAASCFVLAGIDVEKMTQSLTAVTTMLVEIMTAMKVLNGSSSTTLGQALTGWVDAKSVDAVANQLIKLSAAVLIMSFALKNVSDLNWDQIGVGLTAIGGSLAELIAAMKFMPKDKEIKKLASTFITMGIAINIMALALKQLSGLNLEQVGIGLAGIGGALAAILLTLTGLSFINKESTNFNKIASSVLVMSIALNAIASAVKIFSTMDLPEFITGIIAMTASLVALVAAFYGMSMIDDGSIMKTSSAMLVMGIALNAIAASLKIFGSMGLEEFKIGISGLAISLAALVAAFFGMSKIEGSILKTASTMLIMGVALTVIASALKIFGSLSLEEFITGIVAMTASLVALVAAFVGMSMIEGSIISSASAMVIMGIAIKIIADAVKEFGSMNLDELLSGILGLAGAVAIVVAALAALALIGPSSLVGAASMIIMAAAITAFALALKILSTIPLAALGTALLGLVGGITLLSLMATVLSLAAPAIITFSVALLSLSAAVALLGVGLLAAGTGISMFAAGMTALVKLGEASASALEKAIDLIVEVVGKVVARIIESLIEGFRQVIVAIGECAPDIVDAIGKIIPALLTLLNEQVPMIVDGVLQFIVALIEKLAENIPAIYNAAAELIIAFINGITDCYAMVIEAAFQAIIKFINALSDTIEKHTPELADAIKRLFETIIKAAVTIIVGSIPFLKTSGKELMDGGFLKGLKEKINDVVQIGKDFVMGFVNGVKNTVSEAVSTAKQFGKDVLSTIKGVFDEHSPSKETEKIGKYAVDGLVIGIKKLASKAVTAAKDMSEKTLNAFDLSNISSVIDMDGFSPVITPVLDLTNLQNGASQIDSMFAGRTISATVDAINQNGSASNAVIGELKDEIIKLNERMSNIKVMLDSGTMVGAMVTQMDNQLGRQQVYAGRGI